MDTFSQRGKRAGAALLLMAAATAPLRAQGTAETPAWKIAIEQRHAALIAKNGTGTNTALRDQLLKMRSEDQQARGVGASASSGPVMIASNLAEIDAALTTQLKTIVETSGWPTIHLVGIEASNAAMLVLTHTHDHAWQTSLLPRLAALADHGEIEGSALAFVIDKELVSDGQLQRYGTQFKKLDDGSMAMYGVEDPANLDRRRAAVMLPPMDVYEQMLVGMYHLKVSKVIAMAVKQQ